MSFDRLTSTLIELVGIPSTTGHEEYMRAFLEHGLKEMGLRTSIDDAGNLVGLLPGESRPLMLNAHMDRVPPGRGHTPIIRDSVLYSDGTTNLGADDAAGIAIVLETLRRVIEQHLPHPPVVAVFTVQEEVGMAGATAFDPSPWRVSDGIVFDNAYEAGVVVSRGAVYLAFDIEITGVTGHPGKDLASTVNVIEIFREASYPHGSLADDQTRILVSQVEAGSARNAVPASMLIKGELRSFEPREQIERYKQAIRDAFGQAAQRHGGQATVTFDQHCTDYAIDEQEPLVQTYRAVLEARGAGLVLRPTFIGSDTGAFRRHMKTFTISTGVMNEHSAQECVALDPLEQIVQDTLDVLQRWSQREQGQAL
jgi:tripeptide aminopeptidase